MVSVPYALDKQINRVSVMEGRTKLCFLRIVKKLQNRKETNFPLFFAEIQRKEIRGVKRQMFRGILKHQFGLLFSWDRFWLRFAKLAFQKLFYFYLGIN